MKKLVSIAAIALIAVSAVVAQDHKKPMTHMKTKHVMASTMHHTMKHRMHHKMKHKMHHTTHHTMHHTPMHHTGGGHTMHKAAPMAHKKAK